MPGGPREPTTLKGQDGSAHRTCRVFSPQFPTQRPRSAARSSAPSRAAAARPRAGSKARAPLPGQAARRAGGTALPSPRRRDCKSGRQRRTGPREPSLPRPRGAGSPRPSASRRSGGGGNSQGLQVLELLQLLRVVPPPLLLPAPLQLLLGRLPRPPHSPGPRIVAPRPGRHRGPPGEVARRRTSGGRGGEDGTSFTPRPAGPAAPPPAARPSRARCPRRSLVVPASRQASPPPPV